MFDACAERVGRRDVEERDVGLACRAVLGLLWRQGGALSEQEISRELEIDRAGLDRLLRQMADQGLIRFWESGADNRVRDGRLDLPPGA
jgi:DNA-binding MarR family transcriptional regulator